MGEGEGKGVKGGQQFQDDDVTHLTAECSGRKLGTT